MRIGFCGSGLMGGPMVLRLLRAGHEVHVWNRTAGRTAPLAREGAIVEATPAAVAAASEVVCLCLYDAKVVEKVVFGPDGVAKCKGFRWLIDHSSMAPPEARAFAERLAAENGAVWMDAPVSGGTVGAEAGTLIVLAGGPADVVNSASELMRAYAARITYMGPVGAGQTAKLCSQTIVATTIVAIAEAVGLARNCGLDPARLTEAFGGGWADSKLLQIFVPRMASPPPDNIGGVSMMLKDLGNIAALAQQTGTPMPLNGTVQQMLRLTESLGLGNQEVSQVVRLFQKDQLTPQ